MSFYWLHRAEDYILLGCDTASYPGRIEFSAIPLWKPHTRIHWATPLGMIVTIHMVLKIGIVWSFTSSSLFYVDTFADK
jgi:hypothetical protein